MSYNKAQIIELKKTHSYKQLSELTGRKVGALKAMVSRAKVPTDNQQHRALFRLPDLVISSASGVAVVELPPQQAITGDKELDAVLWLRACIDTGQSELIRRALEASQAITTPADELERRYMAHLVATTGNTMIAVFKSMNFADLETRARVATGDQQNRNEAASRFGNDPDLMTEADLFCIRAMKGLELDGMFFNGEQVAERFNQHPEHMPHTLSDCLYELAFWRDLYRLRWAAIQWDGPRESNAREDLILSQMTVIRPCSKVEAMAVFEYVYSEHYQRNLEDAKPIFKNILCL